MLMLLLSRISSLSRPARVAMRILCSRAVEITRPAGIFGRCCALALVVLLAAQDAGATELTGTITVNASGSEILPGAPPDLPLKQIKVHLGVIERVGSDGIQAFYSYLDSTQTDDDGSYTFDLGADPPAEVPKTTVAHAVVLILESQNLAVAVYDKENDPDEVACLGSKVIDVATHGSTRADIELTAESDNDSGYEVMAGDFRPTEDKFAVSVFGELPRCAEDRLGIPPPPTARYDQRGLTNTKPDRFAHLGIHYVRAYDAYEFVRDGLSKSNFAPVRLDAWDTFSSLAYSCSNKTILIDTDSSVFFSSRMDSIVYATRHEYGHHFMCASPIAGDDLMPPLAINDSHHGGLGNSNSAGAWTEGFATWFPAALADYNEEDGPHIQVTRAGAINLRLLDALIDDPFLAGEQRTYDNLGEELSVASVLWEISEATGWRLLSDALEGAPLYLGDFSQVYAALEQDPSVSGFLDTLPCEFLDTGGFMLGIGCLFIDRGFYHDRNGDGLYGPDAVAGGSEEVGRTRWPLTKVGSTSFRPDTPEIDGSRLRLSVTDGAGDPVLVEAFEVAIEYDAPMEQENFEYLAHVFGDAPWEFSILVPGLPSRALITPVTTGEEEAPPLVVESSFFHDAIDSLRDGGVSPILAEHTFVVVPEPGRAASVLAVFSTLALLVRRCSAREALTNASNSLS